MAPYPFGILSLAVHGLFLAGLALAGCAGPASASATDGCVNSICWQIENRFRLFQDKNDFDLHAAAWVGGSEPVFDMEHKLAAGKAAGWAGEMVNRLCFEERSNVVSDFCVRDGVRENYLNPISFAVRLKVKHGPDKPVSCAWTFPGQKPSWMPKSPTNPCDFSLRLSRGKTRIDLAVTFASGAQVADSVVAEPTDALVAGMGDSFTSGEGNPDIPVRLRTRSETDQGACIRRVYNFGLFGRKPPGYAAHRDALDELNSDEELIYVPSRSARVVSVDCDSSVAFDNANWTATRAQWMYAPCHRSLYSYQLRAALALAIENPHRSITYIPLGCTGATIQQGLFEGQAPRERQLRGTRGRVSYVATEGQLSNLRKRSVVAGRAPDLIFLSIGGNDIGFAGLVTNAIVTAEVERWLLGVANMLITTNDARARFPALEKDFRKLRAALKKVANNDLGRVVFVPYGNPIRDGAGQACPASRFGFDAHPAFGMNEAVLKPTDAFIEKDLIPELEQLATCSAKGAGRCADARSETMRFAATHRFRFEQHGLCAKNASEPAFDKCFKNGDTFKDADDNTPLTQPFKHCSNVAMNEYRPYASRGRWTRTVNDSFMTAMSYPDNVPAYLKGAWRDDGLWGLLSMVMGGALHPTAEGHAAMADAALIEGRVVLNSKKGP